MSSWWSLLTIWCCLWSCLVGNMVIFWPDPGDMVHFDVIFPLIQNLLGWSEKGTLMKVQVMLVVFWMKWLTSLLRLVISPIYWSKMQPGSTNMASYNSTLKPHGKLKWQKTNWMFPSLMMMMLQMNRYYAWPVMVTSDKHSKLCNTLFTFKVFVQHWTNNTELWSALSL